jgi:hypothetical protein
MYQVSKCLRRWLCVSLGGVLLLGACASKKEVELNSVAPADFSGSWELDYKQTENSREKLSWLYDIAMSQQQQQQAVRRNDIKNGRDPGYVNNRVVTDLRNVIGLGSLAEMIARTVVLTIEQTPEYIVVEREDDYSLTCDFALSNRSGTKLGEEYCGFDDEGQLRFIVALPEGLTVQHRMLMSESGDRLNVATTVSSSGHGRSFTLNRVYMPFEPGKGGYQCEYTLEKKKTCWFGPLEPSE